MGGQFWPSGERFLKNPASPSPESCLMRMRATSLLSLQQRTRAKDQHVKEGVPSQAQWPKFGESGASDHQ